MAFTTLNTFLRKDLRDFSQRPLIGTIPIHACHAGTCFAENHHLAGSEHRSHKRKLIMLVRFGKAGKNKSRVACGAMTLVEVLLAIVILATVMGGIMMGYVQANRMAEFSSMSLAAQSTASQGVEQALAARWDGQNTADTNHSQGHADELGLTNNWIPMGTNYLILDIPVSGAATPVVNYVTITQPSFHPPIRQIRSDAVWTFPLTGVTFTNTMITLRAPDQ
jgi:type II secretory pathway pseudopilin PulG